jgi:hypothetical protein
MLAGTGLARTGLVGSVLAGIVAAGTVLAGIGATLLAGCGSSGSSPPPRSATATIAQMKEAVNAASSVHLDGTLHGSGKAIGLNIGLIRSGGFSGTITDNGIPLTLTDTGRQVYVRATPAFLKDLRVSATLCSIMCGKYVEMTTAQGDALAGNLTMQKLLASLTGPLPKFADAGTTTVGGRQAQVLRASDGSMLDVAATGPPYPLRALGKDKTGRLDFTQWNSVPRPAAPPASQVINLARLGSP